VHGQRGAKDQLPPHPGPAAHHYPARMAGYLAGWPGSAAGVHGPGLHNRAQGQRRAGPALETGAARGFARPAGEKRRRGPVRAHGRPAGRAGTRQTPAHALGQRLAAAQARHRDYPHQTVPALQVRRDPLELGASVPQSGSRRRADSRHPPHGHHHGQTGRIFTYLYTHIYCTLFNQQE